MAMVKHEKCFLDHKLHELRILKEQALGENKNFTLLKEGINPKLEFDKNKNAALIRL